MKNKITAVFVIILILFNFIYNKSFAKALEDETVNAPIPDYVVAEGETTTTTTINSLIPTDKDGNVIDTTGIIQDITSSTSTVTPGNSSFPTTTTTTTETKSRLGRNKSEANMNKGGEKGSKITITKTEIRN